MSLERQLRTVLAEYAERPEVPRPDFDALTAGGLSLRRRRHQVVVATVGLALVGATLAILAVGANAPDKRGAGDPADRPTSGVAAPTGVAWCVPDPDDPDAEERIVGAGPPVQAWCSYFGAGHSWLHHQAGSTILRSGDGRVYRVADGQLTPLTSLGTPGAEGVWFSHDGRYAVLHRATTPAGPCGRPTLFLSVHEVATADEIAATEISADTSLCYHTAGIDDLGRVYVTASDEGAPHRYERVLMYDVWADHWTEVTGMPAGTGHDPFSYITADGFAVPTEDFWADRPSMHVALASTEGVVDSQGHFTTSREVPVGNGSWSPDRSHVVESRPEGVVARPATDLNAAVILDLPDVEFWDWGFHWESPSSVLATRGSVDEPSTYRCDVRTGACQLLGRAGAPAGGSFGFIG